jgi:hypothetical protein
MKRIFRHLFVISAVAVIAAMVIAFSAVATDRPLPVRAAESHYQVVENWAHFPPGVTKWGAATAPSQGVLVKSFSLYPFRQIRNASLESPNLPRG